MCKEDVRIGRKKAGRVVNDSAAVSLLGGLAAPGNPNRATIVISLASPIISAPENVVLIRSMSALGPVLGVITDYVPAWVGTVEQYGDGVMGAIYLGPVSGDDPVISVAEWEWRESLDQL